VLTITQSVPLYASYFDSVLLYRIIPVIGDAGLSPVVPTGTTKDPVD
jgi:hypothetical protein